MLRGAAIHAIGKRTKAAGQRGPAALALGETAEPYADACDPANSIARGKDTKPPRLIPVKDYRAVFELAGVGLHLARPTGPFPQNYGVRGVAAGLPRATTPARPSPHPLTIRWRYPHEPQPPNFCRRRVQ